MSSAMKQAKDFAKFSLKQSKQLAKYNNELERENVALQHTYNQALAKENRDWQEMMSNSAHQREIADLKAAGLNPVLSVTGGSGAATPSGSSASVSKPNVDMSLPAKVMDMAMAQLSSATSLQTTAMQTANALTIAREQIANQWAQHITPSGNSYYGQYQAFRDNILNKIYDAIPGLQNFSASNLFGNNSSNNKPKLSFKLGNFGFQFINSLLSNVFDKNNTRRYAQNSRLPDKGSSQYYKIKSIDPHYGGTDIDDLINSLNSGQSLRDYYKSQSRRTAATHSKNQRRNRRTVRRGHR